MLYKSASFFIDAYQLEFESNLQNVRHRELIIRQSEKVTSQIQGIQ